MTTHQSAAWELPWYGELWRKASPAVERRVDLLHVARDQVGAAHDVDREALGHREQLVVGGEDAAGEVACGVEDRGACRAKQRVHHRAGDALEPVAEQCESQRGTRSRRGGLFGRSSRALSLPDGVAERGSIRAATRVGALDSGALIEHDGRDWRLDDHRAEDAFSFSQRRRARRTSTSTSPVGESRRVCASSRSRGGWLCAGRFP